MLLLTKQTTAGILNVVKVMLLKWNISRLSVYLESHDLIKHPNLSMIDSQFSLFLPSFSSLVSTCGSPATRHISNLSYLLNWLLTRPCQPVKSAPDWHIYFQRVILWPPLRSHKSGNHFMFYVCSHGLYIGVDLNRMFIGPCIIVIVELKTNLMSLVVFISLIFAQHVSNINMSIFRSLRLWWWITTSVILFSIRCVMGFAAGDAWWCPFCRLKH